MDLVERLNKLSSDILDAEIKLRKAKHKQQAIETEIAAIEMAEANLSESKKWMKKKKTVASFSEFKNVKKDLQTAFLRKAFLLNDLDNYNQIVYNYEKFVEELKKLYDELLDLTTNPVSNVIVGKFRKEDE